MQCALLLPAIVALFTACGSAHDDTKSSPTKKSVESSDEGSDEAVGHLATTDAGSPCGEHGVQLEGLSVAGSNGSELRILDYDPKQLVVGNQSWLVELVAQNELVAGAARELHVVPFMPGHGHGTAVAVEVGEEDPGKYRLEPINLRMPGYWLITVKWTAEDAEGEAASESFVIDLCVQ